MNFDENLADFDLRWASKYHRTLEIIELNSVLCSMEISKPETLNLTISNIDKNRLSKQVEIIEIFDDDDLKDCTKYVIEPNSVCVNNNGGSSTIRPIPIKKKKKRIPPQIRISRADSSPQIKTDDSVIIILDDPMDIVEDSTKFSLNESINEEHVIDRSDTFVNLRSRKMTRERRSMYNISNLDETIILEEEALLDERSSTKENDEEIVEQEVPMQCKRTLRKRICHFDNGNEDPNKVKVKKLNNGNNIEKYYLNKKVKRLPSTLETIFEEPKQQNNQKLYLSSRKLKRVLSFHEDITQSNKLKSRKRLNKAKKLPSSKKFINRKKVSMETLMNKLTSLESDD